MGRSVRIGIRAVLLFAAYLAGVCSPADAQKVTLVAVGDVCLAHGVERAMASRGSGYPFAALKPLLKRADIAICNLECCLATGGKKVEKQYSFRGRPTNAAALRDAGFTLACLANNHSLDFGRGALGETVRALRSCGIEPVGAGDDLADAESVRVVEVNGIRVGFLGYLGLLPPAVPLRKREPGVAVADLTRVRHFIRAARPQVDFLVVSLHFGKEYTFRHNARQAAVAHAAVDAGADLVIGHHPHVVQDAEIYRGKPIFYSLGNCVFDPSPTFLRDGGKRWSAMLVAVLEKGQPIRARLVDLRIRDRQPRLAHPAEDPFQGM